MSTTQKTVVPPTPIGPGLAQSVIMDTCTAGQLTALITPLSNGAILGVTVTPATLGTSTFRLTNTINSDGTVSLISGQIGLTRTDTNNQPVLINILSRG